MSRFDIKFVRGPLSAKVLGSNVQYISDPAILAPRFIKGSSGEPRPNRIGFIPYYRTDPSLQSRLAKAFNLHHISTSLAPKKFIAELTSCEAVICEAMHGAILADAYRIPWAAVRLSSGVLEGRTSLFKWQDWMQSLSISTKIYDAIPRPLLYAPEDLRKYLDGYAMSSASRVLEQALKSRVRWTVSEDSVLHAAQNRILEQAEALKTEYS